MASFEANEAAAIVHGRWVDGIPSEPLQGFAIDTRVMESGQTFVALKTARRDGHDYLEMARDRQAQAALVSTPAKGIGLPQLVVEDPIAALQSLARLWRQRFKGPVIAVSGSFGKTTVRELLGRALGSHWWRTRGNLNNYLGVPISLLELDSRYYAGGIIEAGINETGEMSLLGDLIDPDLAVITGVGPAHLEKLGTVAGVAREKAELVKSVRRGGRAVIPASLVQYPEFVDLQEGVALDVIEVLGITERVKPAEQLEVHRFRWEESGRGDGSGVLVPESDPATEVPFVAGSQGMVTNLALVVHVALKLGVPLASLSASLDGWRPFRHRGEVKRFESRHYYIDAYNANPVSMLDSLERFEKLFADSPHLYVIGSMEELGRESESWHRDTASRMPIKAGSCVYLVGSGAEAMREGLLKAGVAAADIFTRADAASVRSALEPFEGAVFLKGSRSYALEQLVEEEAVRC